MPALVVLFNIKNKEAQEAYEEWAQKTDVPTVKSLDAIDEFKVYRLNEIMGTGEKPPYQYCEVLDINDMTKLVGELSSDTMKRVAQEFQAFADNPMFIVSEQFA